MAVGGKMPPLVTHLEGDLSDLANTFREGTVLAEEYSAEMDHILTDGMSDAGRDSSGAFRERAGDGFDGFFDDIDAHFGELSAQMHKEGDRAGGEFFDGFDDSSRRNSRRAGRRFGSGFFEGFSDLAESAQRMMIPLLIVAAVAASPVIAAVIASAVTIGLGLGFAALGTVIAVAMLPKVAKAFAKLADPIRNMFKYAVTGAFDNALLGVPKIIAAFLPRFRLALRGIFDAVAPLLKPLITALGQGIGDILVSIGNALTSGQSAILTWINTIPEVAGAIGELIETIAKDPEALSRFIGDAATFLTAFITDSGKVIAWLTGVYDWIVKINDASGGLVINNPARIVEGLELGWNEFTSWISGKWDQFTAWLGGKWDGFTAWVAQIPGRIEAFFRAIPGFFIDLGHAILFGIGWTLGQLVKLWLNAPSMLVGALKSLWNFFWGWFLTIVGTVIGLAGKAVSGVIGWFKQLPGRSVDTFKELKTKVIDFFKGAPGWLYNAGKDLIMGLIHGIGGALSWAVDKAKSAAHDIAEGFKSALGIHSPSTLAAGFGRFWMHGFAGGVLGSIDVVRSAWGKVVNTMGAGSYGRVGAEMGARVGTGANLGDGDREAVVELDGQAVGRALIPSTQRTASRSNTTGLGSRTVLGFGGY